MGRGAAYAAQVPSPKAALALVERACAMIGTPAPRSVRLAARRRVRRRVAALIADDEDLVDYVARLETMVDDTTTTTTTTTTATTRRDRSTPRARPDELVAEVERFLGDRDHS